MRLAALALACGGCELAFPLDDDAPCPGRLSDADEDGDAFADVDDNCPAVGNDQTDSDGDGVGDACDPHPDAVDKLCFFGFNRPEELDHVELFSDNWEVVGGDLLQTAKSSRDALRLRGELLSPTAILRARDLGPTTNDFTPARVGVAVAGVDLEPVTPTGGVVCDVHNTTAGPPNLEIVLVDNLFSFVRMPVVDDANRIEIVLSAAATETENRPTCTGGHGGASGTVMLPDIVPQTGQVAVFVEQSTVTIEALQLISAVE